LISSCKSDDNGDGSNACNSSFDQSAMFTNIADNIIIPAFSDLQSKVNQLSDKGVDFTNNTNLENLDNLRTAYLQAYLAFQSVAQFEFGPAESVFLRNSLGNFPTSEEAINANIQAGSYDFSQPDVFYKGFPAVDFLLFGLDTDDAALVDLYTNSNAHQQYLGDLIDDIKNRTDQSTEDWKSSYRSTFVNNTGTAAGTSLSLLINALNENYELIKRRKIGIPSGVLTLGFINPEEVETFYSGHGVQMAVAALKASQQLYLGKDGLGLDDFLMAVDARKEDTLLDELIKIQFSNTIAAVGALDDPLSQTVENDQAAVEDAYNEIAKQLVNIKTDMPSVLCVSITYIDNPSDSD